MTDPDYGRYYGLPRQPRDEFIGRPALLVVVVPAVFPGGFDEWTGHLDLALSRIRPCPTRR